MWQPDTQSLIDICQCPDTCFATFENNPPDELLEQCRVVPPTIFSIFSRFFERQELLELTSNNSVLVVSSCTCFSVFRAAHFEVHPELKTLS